MISEENSADEFGGSSNFSNNLNQSVPSNDKSQNSPPECSNETNNGSEDAGDEKLDE